MKEYILIIGLTIFGGLALSGYLIPTIENLTDVIIAGVSGDPLFEDFDAKFIKAE